MALTNIDKESDIPLYIQIRSNIEKAIKDGELKAGDRLPPVTALAKDIGVTQATIRRALQDLTDAGVACCHVGRGTFIQTPPQPAPAASTSTESIPRQRIAEPGPVELAARRLRSGVGKALSDIVCLANKPGIIHLTRGIPDPGMLPDGFLEQAVEQALTEGSVDIYQATEPLGLPQLRQEIASRYQQAGLAVNTDQVLITNGSIQAITLVAQHNMDQRRKVICETPCFTGVTDTFTAMGHWVETVARDKEGPRPELLAGHGIGQPSLLYLCPYAHNPTGTNLSDQRRDWLVSWAKETGSTILADEIFRDLNHQETPPQSLLHSLGSEQTIIVNSMSKAALTGLRLGWLVSSPARIAELARLKRLMDHSTPTLVQATALSLFQSGAYDKNARKMRDLYHSRVLCLQDALERHMPDSVRWSKPDGGFSLMLELPNGYSSVALFLAAIDKGVAFLPGPLFDIDQRYVHCCRLSCAWASEEKIDKGIELLGQAVRQILNRPPGDSGLSGLGSFQ